jgi:adenosylcobinamide-GDP ribazoletransferase
MKPQQNEDAAPESDGLAVLLRAIPGDFLMCLAFFSRLPVPGAFDATRPLSRACQMFPVTGLVIGMIGAIVVACAAWLRLPDFAVSLLAVAAMVLATGALHEDGLADTVDGFGGGFERARKLDIMKDSHIGTYGVLALIGSQGLRVTLIGSLLPLGVSLTMTTLIASQMTSRLYSMWLWARLPPARSTGLSRHAGQPSRPALVIALGTTCAALLGLMLVSLNTPALLIALAATAMVCCYLIRLCKRQIGGQTGDTIGAAQQICDLAFMMVFLISIGVMKDFP